MRPRGAATAVPLLCLVLACGAGDRATGVQTQAPAPAPSSAVAVDVVVDVDSGRTPISPYIYGSNQDRGGDRWTVRRWGGNRTTGYNWVTNFSNAGSDYNQQSDLYAITSLGLPASNAATPARAVSYFHDQSLATGAQSVVTLQMAGFVAADANGPVSPAEAAPSARWRRVLPRKGAAFADPPNAADTAVYVDELVHYLVARYGPAGSPRGIRWYSLDNEPGLWPATHPRIHPAATGAAEVADRAIALASAVKDVDPGAQILGPAAWGMPEYLSMQDAPDWPQVRGASEWYVDYYLGRMRDAGQAAGRRLLDVLDVHWYPAVRGDHPIIDSAATTAADAAARLQAPRSLWDSTYLENSWVAQSAPQFLPILPRLQRSIARTYPGTKLSVSEYQYGGGSTVSGGLAEADVLGIFGAQGVSIATLWGIGAADTYTAAAFALYRNYDGQGGAFGDTGVPARTSDRARASAYASIAGADPSALHVVLLNRSMTDSLRIRMQVNGATRYTTLAAWGFDAGGAQITSRPGAAVSGNVVEQVVAPLTALHVVLRP